MTEETSRPALAGAADRAIAAMDALAWQERRLELPFTLGERPVRTVRYAGLLALPDPFSTTAFDDPPPPCGALAAHGRRAAFVYSCPVSASLPRLAVRRGHVRYVPSQYPHYAVDVGGAFDDYCAGFRGKTLSTIRRKVRKAAATNRERPLIVCHRTPAELESFFDHALPISRRSYQQRLFGNGLPETEAFRDRVMERAERGEILGFVLFLHDRPAAYTLCPRTTPGTVLYDHTGYDPEHDQLSPGTVLQFGIIETLFDEPEVRTYDLCTGGGRHKELFATRSQPCANIHFAALVSLPALAALAHCLVTMANEAAVALLDALNLRERVKKLIRRRA